MDARQQIPPLITACIAECIGTFALVFASCGAIVIDTISGGQITHAGVGLVFGLVIVAMLQHQCDGNAPYVQHSRVAAAASAWR